MAGVAVLQPQDVLKQRVSYRRSYVQPTRSRRNSSSNPVPNPNSNPKNNNNNNNRRKRSPPKSGSANLSTSPPSKHNHLVMGEVKILKRGEALTNTVSFSKENVMVSGRVVEEDLVLSTTDRLGPDVMVSGGVVEEDLVLSTTDRLGPEPHMVSNQMSIADFYAGSAFFTSPPPSSVPLPAFFKKKNENNGDATSDLIRLLRLDLE